MKQLRNWLALAVFIFAVSANAAARATITACGSPHR